MDRLLLGAALVAVPTGVLLYFGYRVVKAALAMYRDGRAIESLGLIGTTIIAAGLVGKFGNEKTILVAALLSWILLAAAFIRFLMRDDGVTSYQVSRYAGTANDQDPNSIHFSGVGRGLQGFGMYAGGVRIGHDPIDDD